jgi:S-adenosylmethionine decarboxylase
MQGIEWVVEAWGCSVEALRDPRILESLFESLIAELRLRTVGRTLWHQFPGTGGITGLCMLSESHLTCHTFPEHQSLCLNLFCCVPRAEWGFETELQARLGANQISVRRLTRAYELPREQHASD